MILPKRYNPQTREPELLAWWQANGTYHYEADSAAPTFAIDTPPPTVSGKLHLGHVYSYSHADFIARFKRMTGHNVYYPMGYDDNGLPTERLVEQTLGIRASAVGRAAFIDHCLTVSAAEEKVYEALWQRLGLSVDWRFTYRSIDEASRRISQWSFVDLHSKDLVYRQKAPTIWCPECLTAIAQAEVADLTRTSEFVTIPFALPGGDVLPVATTRPELLPACVAVFVHPADARFSALVGQHAITPLFNMTVPILADEAADPDKGTGAVMCCTFGDSTDVAWWRTHNLALIELLNADGTLGAPAGALAGLSTSAARREVIAQLAGAGQLLARQTIEQNIGVHERCDTPVEYMVTQQWFVRVLAFKSELLALADAIAWYPAHMKLRYRQWVTDLSWDWCISRQRYFGVPFPVWYCLECGEPHVASPASLPVDPTETAPPTLCAACGGRSFTPDSDVMDTWATSSMSPDIAANLIAPFDRATGRSPAAPFPFSLRPQAHEIIRTWAFYTLVKSWHHFGTLPFKAIALSGWGLAPEGTMKISKSRGSSGLTTPREMLARFSADAVRYWAASTGFGKDSRINEAKIEAGERLVTKLWHAARFCSRFFEAGSIHYPANPEALTLADRWMLARVARLIERVTTLFEDYEYAAAKSELEAFFWRDFADNYLEMAKQRLYEGAAAGARYVLHQTLLAILKMLAPLLPYVTEQIYRHIYAGEPADSIHRSRWPVPDTRWHDETMLLAGEFLIEIATGVRRYKSSRGMSLGAAINEIVLVAGDIELAAVLKNGSDDLRSITRGEQISVRAAIADELPNGAQFGIIIDGALIE